MGYGSQSNLYSNISSCVLNYGFVIKHFNLSRIARQGCPLSGILLIVIGVEILSNAIKRSKEIEGIAKECLLPTTEYILYAIEKLTCKTIYNTSLNHQHLPPPTADKRLIEHGFIFQDRQKNLVTSFSDLFVLQMK